MIFSAMINQYLAQDPEIAQRLAEHDGKILKIVFLGFNFIKNNHFFVFIHQDTISISTKSEFSPHVIIRGTPLNLLAVGLSKNNTIPENIQITGDVLLINHLRTIFKDINIDWTEILSKITGDPIAYAANKLCTKLKLFNNQASQNLSRDLREYLQEEYRFLVPRAELEDFYTTIDNLRDSTERLQVRLEMLETTA